MPTLEAIRNHPFYGRSKRKGDRYEASAFDANLMVRLGHARYVEDAQPAAAPSTYQTTAEAPAKRGRGRPRKNTYQTAALVAAEPEAALNIPEVPVNLIDYD